MAGKPLNRKQLRVENDAAERAEAQEEGEKGEKPVKKAKTPEGTEGPKSARPNARARAQGGQGSPTEGLLGRFQPDLAPPFSLRVQPAGRGR